MTDSGRIFQVFQVFQDCWESLEQHFQSWLNYNQWRWPLYPPLPRPPRPFGPPPAPSPPLFLPSVRRGRLPPPVISSSVGASDQSLSSSRWSDSVSEALDASELVPVINDPAITQYQPILSLFIPDFSHVIPGFSPCHTWRKGPIDLPRNLNYVFTSNKRRKNDIRKIKGEPAKHNTVCKSANQSNTDVPELSVTWPIHELFSFDITMEERPGPE